MFFLKTQIKSYSEVILGKFTSIIFLRLKFINVAVKYDLVLIRWLCTLYVRIIVYLQLKKFYN